MSKPTAPLCTATRGAAAELQAAAYLMGRGYHVFRAQSPACPFDLVAYSSGCWLRVEVKTGGPGGCGWPSNEEWDLLAVVGPDARVFTFAKGRHTQKQVSAQVRDAYPQRSPTVADDDAWRRSPLPR